MTAPVFENPPFPVHPGELEGGHAHEVQPYIKPDPVLTTLVMDKPVPTEIRAAEFGPWITYAMTATQTPFQLLPYDEHRLRAVIAVSGTPVAAVAGVPAGQTTGTIGSQTSPAAGTTITSQALAAGTYLVTWTVELSGTLAAADANNFILTNGATTVATSINTATAGIFAQASATIVIPGGGATLAVKALALATVGAVYQAQLTASLQAVAPVLAVPPTGSVFLGSKAQAQASPALGGKIFVGTVVELRNKRELWIAPDGTNALTVAVLAERYEQ